MATPNVGILTNAGKDLIDRVNAGQTKITFTKIVFSSMDNSQLTDDKIRALTTIAPQEVVINNPEVTLDNNTGETRIRATGNNKALNDGVYVKTYAVYAKDGSSNEILYGITVSPNPNYLPEYDGVTPQAVTYSYKVNISNTTKITFTNSNDVYVSDTDLDEAVQPYAKTVDVNQQLDKKVNVADMRKPASDVAGIEEVNAKQDKIGYTPADDSKVAHLSGANNFDTVPTVKNNPLLLASSLPSDLARTGQAQTFTQPQTFSIAPTITDASQDKGDNQAATMADLKSLENSAWHQLDCSSISECIFNGVMLYKIDTAKKYIYFSLNDGSSNYTLSTVEPGSNLLDFSSLVVNVLSVNGYIYSVDGTFGANSSSSSRLQSSGAFVTSLYDELSLNYSSKFASMGDPGQAFAYIKYDSLVNK